MTLPIEYQNLNARRALEVVLSPEEMRVAIRAHGRRNGTSFSLAAPALSA